MNELRTLGDAVWYSLTHALSRFIGFLPELLGAIIVLVIGWVLSSFLARLLESGLKAIGLERAVQHAGLGQVTRNIGTTWTASRLVAELIKWFVRLIFVQAAASVLGIPQLTTIINSIILFIPNILVALVIIIVGTMIAKFLAGLVRGSVAEMGVGNPNLLANIVQYAVVAFAVIAAIDQLNIADKVVNTLFIGLIGALALAVGLAFGLGGREVAAQITQSWYESGKSMAEQARLRSNASSAIGGPAPSAQEPVIRRYPAGRSNPSMGD